MKFAQKIEKNFHLFPYLVLPQEALLEALGREVLGIEKEYW